MNRGNESRPKDGAGGSRNLNAIESLDAAIKLAEVSSTLNILIAMIFTVLHRLISTSKSRFKPLLLKRRRLKQTLPRTPPSSSAFNLIPQPSLLRPSPVLKPQSRRRYSSSYSYFRILSMGSTSVASLKAFPHRG